MLLGQNHGFGLEIGPEGAGQWNVVSARCHSLNQQSLLRTDCFEITDIDICCYHGYCEKHECIAHSRTRTVRQHQGRIRTHTSASEVVREALRLLEEHDAARATQLAEFNGEIGRRLAALDRGETVTPAEARARLLAKSERRGKPRA